MNRTLFLLAAALIFGFVSGGVAEPPGKPLVPGPSMSSSKPEFILVGNVDLEKQVLFLNKTVTIYQTVAKEVAEKVAVNGMEVIVKKVVYEAVPVQKTVQIAWSGNNDQALDGSGNPLTKEAVFQRLKVGDAVLLLPPGQKLQPAFQRLLHKDAVVLLAGNP